jgi:acyl-[acyl carrier protein]--UDP-N-acetylglucosamine O-acyltransferase
MQGVVLDGLSKIGSNVYIGRYCYITKTRIDNYCSIDNSVSISQGEHDLREFLQTLFFTKILLKNQQKGIVLLVMMFG